MDRTTGVTDEDNMTIRQAAKVLVALAAAGYATGTQAQLCLAKARM
jgi:hypothetical protein